MARDDFNAETARGQAAADLAAMELAARNDLLARMHRDDMPREGLRDDVISAIENHASERKAGKTAFMFVAEPALPVSAKHRSEGFSELLLRMMTREGRTISPYGLIKDINRANVHPAEMMTSGEPYAGWSPWFRRWLAIAQIDSVKGTNARFSVNIAAQDMALQTFDGKGTQTWEEYGYPDFPADLGRAAALCRQTGTPPLIFEATEDEHWQTGRARMLAAIADDTGATVAVDDYGAESQSFNLVRGLPQTAATLEAFAALLPPDRLRVKIDGQIVKNQPQTLDRHLRDVRRLAPKAGVVLEWVETTANTKILLDSLGKTSRAMIVTAQDRNFDGISATDFLAEIDSPKRGRFLGTDLGKS